MSQSDLRTDQKYLYDIHNFLFDGKLIEGMAYKNLRKLENFRRLTTANRILRLHVSTI